LVIADPPLFGAVQEIVFASTPAVAEADVGAPGTVVGVADPDVVVGPLPTALDGVIVNVYAVPPARPVKANEVEEVVCVVVAGLDTTEYSVAAGESDGSVQARLTEPLLNAPPLTPVAVNPVTAFGSRKLSCAEDLIPYFLFAIFYLLLFLI
jgi:hypothetical protein